MECLELESSHSGRGRRRREKSQNMLQCLFYDILGGDESYPMYFQQAYRCLENFWASKDVLKSCLNRPLKRSLFLITDAMDENKRADYPRELSKPTGKRCVVQDFLASQPIHETHHIKPVDRRIGLQYKNGEYRKIHTTFFKNQYSALILTLGEKFKTTSLRTQTGYSGKCA